MKKGTTGTEDSLQITLNPQTSSPLLGFSFSYTLRLFHVIINLHMKSLLVTHILKANMP